MECLPGVTPTSCPLAGRGPSPVVPVADEAARESSIERRLTLAVSPSGRLRLLESPDASPLDPRPAEAISAAFARGPAAGLFHLGAVEVDRKASCRERVLDHV